MPRPHLRLENGRWNLWRLTDEEFSCLAQHALPVTQNFSLLQRLSDQPLVSGRRLTLGHALVVLERRFGPSSTWYDGHRGSFSFPLLLTADKGRRLNYLLRVHDHRGTVYFPLYRVVSGEPSPTERAQYHEPLTEEFSQANQDEFVSCLYGALGAFAQSLTDSLVSPFCRPIPSDAILFGYENGQFFEYTHDQRDSFEAQRQAFELRLGPRRARGNSNRVELFIERLLER